MIEKTIGILGGGQLGKMMLYQTQKMAIPTKVLDLDAEAVSKNSTHQFVYGDWKDEQTVLDFGKQCDIITVEIEHINVSALEKLEELGKEVYPSSRVLKIIQNKAIQKQFLVNHQLPTADFIRYQMVEEFQTKAPNQGVVWKKATLGYDGFGVKLIRSKADKKELPQGECIQEELVDIEMEISVMVARAKDGTQKIYPPVDMYFDAESNQITYVHYPSSQPQSILDKCVQVAREVSQKLEHIGMLAVELFVTKNGEVWINELAPRPHNSGHLTIEGNTTCQFENHIRAIAQLPLGETRAVFTQITMGNIVGKEEIGQVYYPNLSTKLQEQNLKIHLYGKTKTKPNRKLGHFTLFSDTEDTLTRAKALRETIEVKVR